MQSSLQPGTILRSQNTEYRIEKMLGSGGFGITYLAIGKFKHGNVTVESNFAIKEHFMETCYRDGDGVTVRCTPTSQISVEQSRKDFLNEAKKLQKICQLSEHIVNVNETFEANGTAYYVMEYLDGGSPGKMDEKDAVNLILQVAEAVKTLHDNKLLHLDIKPDNILVKNDGNGNITPVLIDFGLAKHFDKKGNPTSTPNAKGLTQGFAPVEQGGIISEFAPTLDVYALGATLLYLLTGKNPPSSTELVDANQTKLKTLIPANVSDSTRNAILHAMTPNKDLRTPNVSSFINELTNGAAEIKTPSTVSNSGNQTVTINQRKPKPPIDPKKKKYILWGLGVVVVVAISLFIIFATKDSVAYNNSVKDIEAENKIVDELNDAFAKEDYSNAIQLANQIPDNSRAQFILGCLYQNGEGVQQDYHKALEWYTKSADNNNPEAMSNIGYMYKMGQGTSIDYDEAKKWYEKAADLGDELAMWNMGFFYESGLGVKQDYNEAKKWYIKAADAGDSSAMYVLGSMYENGEGVEKSYAEALNWFQKAADLGNADAMYRLGNIYDSGEGVEKNYGEAFKWYHKAADLGNTDAMTNIGYMYDIGRGVETNDSEAIKWYKKAAELGNELAMYNLGSMYAYGEGTPVDYAEAIKWYQKSADLGNPNAPYQIAEIKNKQSQGQ